MTRAAIDANGGVDELLLERLDEERLIDGVPGLSVGVLHGGRIATAGLGVSDVRSGQPVDGETLFQIGSVSKTFTATALLQLVERDTIDLDDPIVRHLPEFRVADPDVTRAVTIRDCVTHSPGWDGDVFADTGWGEDALAIMVDRMHTLRQVTPRGKMWAYNNAAFYPLGRLLERIHGRPYEDVIRTEILEPLGMEGACFFAHDAITRPHAVGHAQHEGRTVVVRPWAMPRSSNPVGGVVASAENLMEYARFQITGGARILSDEHRLSAFRPAGPESDAPEIGVGWWLEHRGGTAVVSHGGGANGQPCHFAMVPSRGFAMAVLTNGFGGGTTARRVVSWAIGEFLGLAPETVPETSVDDGAFDAEALGVYDSYLDRWTLLRHEGELAMDSVILGDWLDGMFPPTDFRPTRIPVRPIGADRMLVGPGERWESTAELIRDDNGDIGWMRHHLRAGARTRQHLSPAP